MIQVKSNGLNETLPFTEGMTVQGALEAARVSSKRLKNTTINVGDSPADYDTALADGDVVTIIPNIKNG